MEQFGHVHRARTNESSPVRAGESSPVGAGNKIDPTRLFAIFQRPGRQRSHSSPITLSSYQPDFPGASPSEDSLKTPRAEPQQTLVAASGILEPVKDYFPSAVNANQRLDPIAGLNVQAQPIEPSLSVVSASAETSLPPSSALALEHLQEPPKASEICTTNNNSAALESRPNGTTIRARSKRSMTGHPAYPDQSHPALQPQVPPKSHYLWRKDPNAAGSFGSSASSSMLSSVSSHFINHERDAKTTNSSPAHTPGLHTPKSLKLHHLSGYETPHEASPYPSPYLHPVQPQPPKETHRAEKDVDTFSGRKRINQYEIREELGRGVHGKVKLARNLDNGDYVAIKIVQRYPKRHRLGKAETPEDKVKKEIAILKKVSHLNVVSLLEVIDDPDLAKIYIVLEFCELRGMNWRTLGDSAVVYVEEMRLRKLARGSQILKTTPSEARILKGAERREKRRRAIWRQRQRSHGASGFWSLEFAEDSGGDSSEGISRTSSAVTDSHSQPPDLVEVPEVGVIELPSRSALDGEAVTPGPGHATLASEQLDDYLDVHAAAYGQPMPTGLLDHHANWPSSRQRAGSLTESVSSEVTEAMEEVVPEDHRYVPIMTLPEIRRAFRDAVLGLEYLHYHGIVHRDIKPANLLRTQEHVVKISDFGVSYLGKPIRDGQESEDVSESESHQLDEETELAKTVGTPAFYAPELCSLDITSQTVVTGQIDIWALGVTLYCLIFARTPFTADNTFALMKTIAEADVLIPRKRLKAVEPRPSSSSIRTPVFRPSNGERRLAHELLYDDVDDILYDLLKRLLIKDPAKRITIKEVKHHPWVVADIQNKTAWLDETDPSRHTQGKKIEISHEEVQGAVIPLKVVDRVKSLAKRAAGKIGLVGRKDSHASSTDSPATIAHKKDGHRLSIKPEESLQLALSTSRDHEAEPHSRNGNTKLERRPDHSVFFREGFGPLPLTSPPRRPTIPNRVNSESSTANSIKTIRQQDFDRGRTTSPTSREFTATSALGMLFNEAGDKILRSVRSRDRKFYTTGASSSPRRGRPESDNVHGEPTLAVTVPHVTGTMVRGLVPSPTSSTLDSAASSPLSSTYPSSDRLDPATGNYSGRQASPMVPRSRNRAIPTSLGGGLSRDTEPYSPRDDAPSEEEVFRIKEMIQRRRKLEDERSNPSSNSSRPTSALVCPPSPDDDLYEKQLAAQAKAASASPCSAHTPGAVSAFEARVVSSSSEEHVASGASQSTFPSMASMMSKDTSVLAENETPEQPKQDSAESLDTENTASGTTSKILQPPSAASMSPVAAHSSSGFLSKSEDEGYVGDTAVEPDEYQPDSDSDDDFIIMTRKRTETSRLDQTPRTTA